MASIIHDKSGLGMVWVAKADKHHFRRCTAFIDEPWRYIIARGNRIEGIEARE